MSAPAVSVERLDTRLQEVRAAVERMGSNLVALDADPVRQILDTSALTGASAEEWQRARASIDRLWQGHASLSAVVREATDLRQARRRPNDADLARLASLLLGPSVARRADPDAGPPTLAGLTAAEPGAALDTVDDTIAALSADFDAIVGTVSKASAVWERVLPRLGDLDAALDADEAAARAGGARVPNEVAAARRRLKGLRERCVADPLSVDPAEVEQAETATAQAKAGIAEELRGRHELTDALDEAAHELDRVAALLSQAADEAAEGEAKLARWRAPAADLDRAGALLAELRAELASVGAPTQAGDPPTEMAVRRLRAMAAPRAELVAEATQLAAACRAGLAARAELRGRLSGYRARASASGRAEDLVLDGLYQQAEQALYTAPCDLQEAARLVGLYQQAVRDPDAREDR